MISKTPHLIYFKTDGMRKELSLNDFSQLMCDFLKKWIYFVSNPSQKDIESNIMLTILILKILSHIYFFQF